jgi:hypothetical protein
LKLTHRFRTLIAAGGLCAATTIGGPGLTASAATIQIAHIQPPSPGVPNVPIPNKHMVFNLLADPSAVAGHVVLIVPPQLSSGGSCPLGVAAIGGLVSVCAKQSGYVQRPQNFMHDPQPGGGGLLPGSGCGEAGCSTANGSGFPDDAIWSRIADGSYFQYFMRPVEGSGASQHFNLVTQWQSGYDIYRNYHIRYYGYGQDPAGNPSYWIQSGESQTGQTEDVFVRAYDGQTVDEIANQAANSILSTGEQSAPGVLDATGDANVFGEFFQQAAGDAGEIISQLSNLIAECGCE